MFNFSKTDAHICLTEYVLWIYPVICIICVAMPVQYELRRLFHLMNIQTHRNSTHKALILGAYFNSWLRS